MHAHLKTPIDAITPDMLPVLMSIQRLYAVLGRCFHLDEPHNLPVPTAWREVQAVVADATTRCDLIDSDTCCDVSVNTPDNAERKEIVVRVLAKSRRIAEFYGGMFTLSKGEGYLLIDYRRLTG